jgi:diguanylate cyclase (GGDEF)-like protein/PAS domain S-box-containing protein
LFIALMSLVLVIGSVTLRSYARRATEAVAAESVSRGFGDELSRASDYLTDQARDFVAEDERPSLALYREEVESERRREKALERASVGKLPPAELDALLRAKRESDALVEIEARAIRLAAEARGIPESELPSAYGSSSLTRAERVLPGREKLALAQDLVFGTVYWTHKRELRRAVEEFRVLSASRASATIGALLAGTDRNFALVAALCALALVGIIFVAILNYRLIILPVRDYIRTVSTDEPGTGYPELRPRGVYELTALGEAINRRRAQRIRTERALRDSELKLRTNLLMMPLAAMEIDASSRILSWNPAAELMFGYLEKEVVGRDVVELLVPAPLRGEILDIVRRIALGDVIDRQVNENLTKDGRIILCEWYNTPLYDSRGAWIGWVSLVKDITEQQAEADKILYQSRHDPLTGLYNRRSMQEKIEGEHLRSKRTGSAYSCIMLDIDKFKNFNDSYGHECGDVVLKGVAEALVGTVRATDSVSRWGGEEFLILMPETDPEGGAELAEKIRARIQAEAIAYGELSFKVTVTAGVASCRSEQESEEDCIRRADEALLTGKAAGRNRVVALS